MLANAIILFAWIDKQLLITLQTVTMTTFFLAIALSGKDYSPSGQHQEIPDDPETLWMVGNPMPARFFGMEFSPHECSFCNPEKHYSQRGTLFEVLVVKIVKLS